MIVTFPPTCTTDASRMAWCCRAQKKLIQLHNAVGKWYREGISENTYNQFPNKVKNRYSYSPQLSQADWDDFDANVFSVVLLAISSAERAERAKAFDSTYWSIDLDGDIN
jgi:hypothetical protein